MPQLAGVTYTQSSVYSQNTAATYGPMNDGSADGSLTDQTGTSGSEVGWIRADCGSSQTIAYIVIGYDYLNNLVGGWGPVYTEGRNVQGSNDASGWTTITTTPTYAASGSSNGLVTININQTWRYIRVIVPGATPDYLALLEFQVWSGAAPVSRSAALSGGGTLSATAVQRFPRTSALTGAGVLSATVVQTFPRTSALTGDGALSATAVQGVPAEKVYLGSDWVDRTVDLAYRFQILGNAAVYPQAGWAGDGAKIPIASYAQTMLFNDHKITATMETPAADDMAVLYVRANNSNQVMLLAANNSQWTIYIVNGAYTTLAANATPQNFLAGSMSWVDGDTITFEAKGNCYNVYKNGAYLFRWSDDQGVYAANVDAAHHECAIAYLCSTVSGGFDSVSMDDLYVYPMLTGIGGSGALSASANASYPRSAALSGGGVLSASVNASYARSAALSGDGTLSATAQVIAVTIIGTPVAVEATTIALPAHQVGDLIIMAAGRNSQSAPVKPVAGGTVPTWNDIDSGSGTATNSSVRTVWAIATATNHTSGTWTTSSLFACVLRGHNASTPIGGHAIGGSLGTGTNTAPAVTMTKTDGSSELLHVHIQGAANLVWAAPPAGYTRLASATGSTNIAHICVNSKDVTTSDGALALQSTPAGYTAASLEVRT